MKTPWLSFQPSVPDMNSAIPLSSQCLSADGQRPPKVQSIRIQKPCQAAFPGAQGQFINLGTHASSVLRYGDGVCVNLDNFKSTHASSVPCGAKTMTARNPARWKRAYNTRFDASVSGKSETRHAGSVRTQVIELPLPGAGLHSADRELIMQPFAPPAVSQEFFRIGGQPCSLHCVAAFCLSCSL